MPKHTNKGIQNRILLIEVILFLLIGLLGGTAFKIQVLDNTDLASKARGEYTDHAIIKGKRGDILDRNMNKLATTINAFYLAASPAEIEHPVLDSAKIAALLRINRHRLEKQFKTKKNFIFLKRKISPDLAIAIKKIDIKGVFCRNDAIRFYPNRHLAAQVIGFTGNDNTGLEGLEYQYNSILKGKTAKISVTRDGVGRSLSTIKTLKQHLRGDSIVLTIDVAIQYVCESALKKAVIDNKAKSGMAIVMRPATGEVLAMAMYPEFNPNSFLDFKQRSWRNRTITDPFEPGSVMKVFVAATALDTGVCTPKSIFFCENGDYRIGKFVIHDTHPHGWLTVNQIVKYSSNIGAAKISEVIGRKALYDSLFSFGFGQKTFVGCPGETPGILIPYNDWSDIDAGAIAFGQGISVSALQLITGISAIANGGILMKPLLIKEIISSDGKIKKIYRARPLRRVASIETAIYVKKMMRSVVEQEGTGTRAAINGYSVCGKTGTAQKVARNGKGYSKERYTAVFAGFAPEKKPALVVLVVIDEPKLSHYGGTVAAPAFKKIMTESLNYFHVPPDIPEEKSDMLKEKLVVKNSNGV